MHKNKKTEIKFLLKEKASAEDKTREGLVMDVGVLEGGFPGHQCLPQTWEMTGFKVQLAGGIHSHHEGGVPFLWKTCSESPGVCPLEMLGQVGGAAGGATAAGTTVSEEDAAVTAMEQAGREPGQGRVLGGQL